MPKKTLLVVCVAMTLSITGLTSGQIAPFPKMPEDMTTLLKTNKEAIEARIVWWKNKLLIADTVKVVDESCDKLMQDYARSENRIYKNSFVTSCVDKLLPLLDKKGIPLDDKLRMVKLIHVASFMSKLRDRAILPALQSMVVNENPAVRRLGWEGFKNSRSRFVASRKATDEMLRAIEEALKTEKSLIVLQAVYSLMNFRGIDVEPIPKTTLKKINEFFLKILSATWNTRRLGVQEGNTRKINRASEEIAVLGYLGSVKGVSPKTKTEVLQMLLNMASSAAGVYDRTIETDSKVNQACELLLLECEQNLNGIAETQIQPLVKGLTDKVAPGAAVQRAIFTWSDELKKLGVNTPKEPTPEPPVKPAMAPAEKTE